MDGFIFSQHSPAPHFENIPSTVILSENLRICDIKEYGEYKTSDEYYLGRISYVSGLSVNWLIGI